MTGVLSAVLRECAPTHPGSKFLSELLELGKDGLGSGSSSGSSASADGAGGACTAFFVFHVVRLCMRSHRVPRCEQ